MRIGHISTPLNQEQNGDHTAHTSSADEGHSKDRVQVAHLQLITHSATEEEYARTDGVQRLGSGGREERRAEASKRRR